MPFSDEDVARLAKACMSNAELAATAEGFVPLRNLLNRFKAVLILRPLLVEAMLCEFDAAAAEKNGGARWGVLVDSERYPIEPSAIAAESIVKPLPVRFRNTVAHELAHSLSFRLEEFGISFVSSVRSSKTTKEDVRRIEQATERLSPILVVPSTSLDRWFPAEKRTLHVEDVVRACDGLGVSRYVLINRLNLIPQFDSRLLRERACLRNVAIGIGEWGEDGQATLHGWPIYKSFDRGIIPQFVWRAIAEKAVDGASVCPDPDFALNGGQNHRVKACIPAGTERVQQSESMQVTCTIERASRLSGHRFLFLVESAGAP